MERVAMNEWGGMTEGVDGGTKEERKKWRWEEDGERGVLAVSYPLTLR